MRVDEIRELIELVERSGIGELEVRRGWTSIRIAKQPTAAAATAGSLLPSPAPAAHAEASAASAASGHPAVETTAASDSGLVAIQSPMVGTFYGASSPTTRSYVEPGSRVTVGQVVCIVEAMKHMNEIESEIAGEIVEVLVENGQSVDFNQPLFMVRREAS
ncbi:MAG: acetyl-CoA carboxylase biotin carboxyl carrier protein [Candidatus Eisenbacteria sp.]|nr:acetyl-CoA carboxylase biotin carboxyl carrier protein [Candidatus Eisenbacteria bacterium]